MLRTVSRPTPHLLPLRICKTNKNHRTIPLEAFWMRATGDDVAKCEPGYYLDVRDAALRAKPLLLSRLTDEQLVQV